MIQSQPPLKRIWTVFSKEVIDNLRDRRSMASALASTMIGPALLVILIVVIGRSFFQEAMERKFTLPISGAENAPSLVSFLKQRGVEVVPAPSDLEKAVRNGDVAIVLLIPETYGADFSAGRPATVSLVIDSSRQSSLSEIRRTEELLNTYNRMTGMMRLMARGINPVIVDPLAIERLDTATPQSQVMVFLNMMPYFVIMVIFVGGMHVIIDATAGEKERSSLEPLLINPVARWEFVVGKLMASIPFAILAVFVNLLAFAIAFNAFPLENYVGFQLTISVMSIFSIFLLSLPMILLAAALQMIIATFTRSFKEAQTYVGFLPLIPALPGIGLAFLPVKPTLVTMVIPTFGQQILINQFMRGEPVSLFNVLASSTVTILLALVLTLVAIRLFQQERVLFGTR